MSTLGEDNYPVVELFFIGLFSSKSLFAMASGDKPTLNVFSVVGALFPRSSKDVTMEFAIRVILSWQRAFEVLVGNSSDPVVLDWSLVFSGLVENLRSTQMRLLDAAFVLHMFAIALEKWFDLCRQPYYRGLVHFSFCSVVSARLLLRDCLSNVQEDTASYVQWQTRVKHGKALVCYLGSVRDLSAPVSSAFLPGSSMGLIQACAVDLMSNHLHLTPPTRFKCAGERCSRRHLTAEEVVSEKVGLTKMLSSCLAGDNSRQCVLDKLSTFEI
jgi:hypothetical protein